MTRPISPSGAHLAAAQEPEGPANPGEPLYYAKDGQVWQRPIRHRRDGGGVTIELGFPICSMTEAAGNGAADLVAKLMNGGQECLNEAGRELIALLTEARALLSNEVGSVPDLYSDLITRIDAAVAKVEGRPA